MSRIAIIGSGISGMAAGYFLSRKHDIWLFEREDRLGGHTQTHLIESASGPLAIDTGFIVHNDRTYPNLVRLFAELGVERQKSDMSFGVTSEPEGFQYSSRGLRGFFGPTHNWLRPSQYRLFAEILRFNRKSSAFLNIGAELGLTLGEYLRLHQFSEDFSRLYLYPMASAVWSTSLDEIDEFPAITLLRFFQNHGFLTIDGHPQWYVVKGGSSKYIAPLTAPYRNQIELGSQIQFVTRDNAGTSLFFADGSTRSFDEVVFACHAPQALLLLADPSTQEKAVLSCLRTTSNRAVLHTDEEFLPKNPYARASWNYYLGANRYLPTLTYDMNRLQGLSARENYCVTLNPSRPIGQQKILRDLTYSHPLYTLEAVLAQARWAEISAQRHTHYCGAYWFNGFHEDGLNSALRVARSLGVEW